jgi:hypothetical protein
MRDEIESDRKAAFRLKLSQDDFYAALVSLKSLTRLTRGGLNPQANRNRLVPVRPLAPWHSIDRNPAPTGDIPSRRRSNHYYPL